MPELCAKRGYGMCDATDLGSVIALRLLLALARRCCRVALRRLATAALLVQCLGRRRG